MPYVTVRIPRNNSIEKKRKIVKAMTEALVSILDTKSESVIINFEEVDREDWAVGGVLHYDKSSNKQEDRNR
jgi:4-oxalocrotonate tautomerase